MVLKNLRMSLIKRFITVIIYLHDGICFHDNIVIQCYSHVSFSLSYLSQAILQFQEAYFRV